jgi:alpha-galactosidase
MPDSSHATVAVESNHAVVLQPGESFHTLRTFVPVHQGDYFQTLVEYRGFMMAQGLRPATPPTDGKGAIWCAWGYGRTVRPQQVYDTLPTAKKLAFTWITLDDGWQNNVGDWALDPKKFPNGDADMRASQSC